METRYTMDFPIIDTLLIVEAYTQQLFVLKALLNTFVASTGLKVNYVKSNLVPINVVNDRMIHPAATFGCQIGAMPFSYLGLPLRFHQPSVQDCLSIF